MGQALERVDPSPRTLTGAHAGRIKNKRPDREYLLANMSDDMFGADACENDGWKYIVVGSDKETVTGGKVVGDKIAWRGQVLMWRPSEVQKAYLEEKAAFHAKLQRRKKEAGGPDGITTPDGNPATQFTPGK
jgi:hypothetical protein